MYKPVKGISKEELNNIFDKEIEKEDKEANELKNILEERLYYYKNKFLKRLKEDSFNVLLREELIKAARNKQKSCLINVIDMDEDDNRLRFKEEPYWWGLFKNRWYHNYIIMKKALKKISPMFSDVEIGGDKLYTVKAKDDNWRKDFKMINHNYLSLNTLLFYLCNFETEVNNVLKANNFDVKFTIFLPDNGHESGVMQFYW